MEDVPLADVTLTIQPQVVEVDHNSWAVEEFIREQCSYSLPNQKHIRNYNIDKAKADKDDNKLDYWLNWDGKVSLYKKKEFPIGFLWRIGVALRTAGYVVDIDDKRTLPRLLDGKFCPEFTAVLRPYQEKAVKRLLGRQRGIVDMATGGGKTIVALSLMAQRPTRTFVIVPTIELVNDWLHKMKLFFKFPTSTNYYGFASGRQSNLSLFNVANIQTIHNALFKKTKQPKTLARYQKLQQEFIGADTLIVDECHHAAAETWKKVIMQSNAYYRYGFTATADKRTDFADVEYYGLLGDKAVYVPASQLVESGHISPARVIFLSWGRKYFMRGTKFHGPSGVEEIGIVYNHIRNQKIIHSAWESWMAMGRQTLIMVNRLDHGTLLKDLLIRYRDTNPKRFEKDCRIEWLHGKAKDRNEITKDFREGKVHILVCQSQILGEGIDVPAIACVIMSGAGKSAIRTIQIMGRGIRLAEGKMDLLVYDMADDGLYIREHAEKRLQTYIGESAYKVEAKGTVLEKLSEHFKKVDEL